MSRPVVRLPDDLRRQIIDHCVETLPNEGCGMLATDGDAIVRVYPTRNDDDSPISYSIPPQEHFDALVDAESKGWELGGVFHSHPVGPAAMSETDLARVTDREWVYLVVSLAGSPVVTAWRDGDQTEI